MSTTATQRVFTASLYENELTGPGGALVKIWLVRIIV
jgi:hypothetical protein